MALARSDYRAACRPIERVGRNSLLARVCLARAFLVWNRAGRAFEELEAALAEEARNFDALFALGEAYPLRADLAHTEKAWRRAFAADASRYKRHLDLGQLYAAARRRDDAVREKSEAPRPGRPVRSATR